MKKLRRLLFFVQVVAYGLHAYAHTGLILYPDEPPFDTLSQIETIRQGSQKLPERYRHAPVRHVR